MADKQDTKDEITAVGPGADEDDQESVVTSEGERAGEDYQYPEGEDEEGESREERVGYGTGEEPEDGLTRQQRKRRHQQEKRRREARELAFLRTRNEQLERQRSQDLARIETRQTQSDVIAIDGRITQAQSDVREAETLFAQAVKSGDEGSIAEALRVRDALRDGLHQLQNAKQQTARAAQERQAAASQPPAVDPVVAQRAREWASEHDWFDPQGGDEDSAIAYAIDRRLMQEGRLDPRTDAYWEEYDRRLAKRLPEHYRDREEDEDDEPTHERSHRVNGNSPRKPSGPMIKVGGRERTLRKGEVYIDEDRKAALIEAGVWDDPKEREKYLRAYQKYDRDAGRRPR